MRNAAGAMRAATIGFLVLVFGVGTVLAATSRFGVTSTVNFTTPTAGASQGVVRGSKGCNQIGTSTTITDINLTGTVPNLGALEITLNPASPSTGTLGAAIPPTTHTQNFFVRITCTALNATLVSDTPLVTTASAPITAFPPVGSTYTMTGPSVVFYHEGDLSKTPVTTITGLSSVISVDTPVPTLSGVGVVILVAFFVAGAVLLMVRRRRAVQAFGA